ncbi:AAA family ATPase [Patescibacteria group bacterium]|nr:AAA family ATPase [Patescibacteria group bacterium]MBU4455453.1 AAA family ATPase [Patescibacteria group bacterium]MCG2690706.1 AAA family ATPase [Candidatus Parcubacteria bacterium]
MPTKKIIGLVGKISSGKGTVAKYLEEKNNAVIYRFSTILRDILNRLHKEITRKNMQNLSTILRQSFGEDILAKVIAEDVKKENNDLIVVDGIRRMADIKYLSELPNFKLVKIIAEPEIRYQRLIQRTENHGDTQKTYAEFSADEKKEADAEIPVVMENAEIELNNNGNLEELYKQIDQIIDKL